MTPIQAALLRALVRLGRQATTTDVLNTSGLGITVLGACNALYPLLSKGHVKRIEERVPNMYSKDPERPMLGSLLVFWSITPAGRQALYEGFSSDV